MVELVLRGDRSDWPSRRIGVLTSSWDLCNLSLAACNAGATLSSVQCPLSVYARGVCKESGLALQDVAVDQLVFGRPLLKMALDFVGDLRVKRATPPGHWRHRWSMLVLGVIGGCRRQLYLRLAVVAFAVAGESRRLSVVSACGATTGYIPVDIFLRRWLCARVWT